jgi:hypothetical protein
MEMEQDRTFAKRQGRIRRAGESPSGFCPRLARTDGGAVRNAEQRTTAAVRFVRFVRQLICRKETEPFRVGPSRVGPSARPLARSSAHSQEKRNPLG